MNEFAFRRQPLQIARGGEPVFVIAEVDAADECDVNIPSEYHRGGQGEARYENGESRHSPGTT